MQLYSVSYIIKEHHDSINQYFNMLFNRYQVLTVVVGAHDLRNSKILDRIRVKHCIPHPEFTSKPYRNDIMLLMVSNCRSYYLFKTMSGQDTENAKCLFESVSYLLLIIQTKNGQNCRKKKRKKKTALGNCCCC